ncbi:hypothetical protein QR680_013229 [Steinernema hermaphroditum]|uniref:C2H2-type domain-containing protein n=1 Tax=Steinernema hermaphroditum TaxID=289476 RepID=A0AA39I4S6_9BILA|nr:hypothetical protein QR680_013229 [Steinernema hermaphroditum]
MDCLAPIVADSAPNSSPPLSNDSALHSPNFDHDDAPSSPHCASLKRFASSEEPCSDDGICMESPPHKQTALEQHLSSALQNLQKEEGANPTPVSGNYRTELKRPDLKGSFRCSICQKIFCHSSSLSRHRMQAHFKSYTCTLCRKEITSNETLRAHMYKQHQISRIFMCRCCNWAFPDKTSLHMHMQAKEEGKNISVPVIGKGHAPNTASFSANNGGPFGPTQTPSGAPSATNLQNPFIPLQLHTLAGLPPHQGIGIGDHNAAAANLFPQLSAMVPPNSEDLMSKLRDRFLLNSMLGNAAGAGSFPLANWLANFPNVDASGVGKLSGSLDLRFGKTEDNADSEKEIRIDPDGDDDDELKVTTTDAHIDVVKDSDKDSDSGDELRNRSESPLEHSASSRSEGSPISALRSAIKAAVLPLNISDGDDQVAQGSDVSHVSPTETNSSVSPSGTSCYDCTLNKEKLEEMRSRCRFLEDRTATLQTDALRFSTRLSATEAAKAQHEQELASLRSRLEVLQTRILQVQEKTVAFVRGADLSNPAAISALLNEVLQATLLQQ